MLKLPDHTAPIALHGFLAYRLTKLAYRVTRALAVTYYEAQQLTSSEWKVMSILAETSGLSGTEISQRSTLDRFAVSKTIRRLMERELIARLPAPNRGRAVVMALTDKGWRVYRPIAQQAMRQQEQLLSTLSERERSALFALMDKLESKLDEAF
jgi:DNA-binding MarR family transcriptional regulator